MSGLQAIAVAASISLALAIGAVIGSATHKQSIAISTVISVKLNTAVSIARMYGLSREQIFLLLAIERHEAGRAGLEWGVHNNPYADGNKSYLWACAQACESIKARCPSVNDADLAKMGSRYAADPEWHVKVKRHLQVVKRQVILP